MKKTFKREYIGEWVEPDIKTRERNCGCIEALRVDIDLWERVSYCIRHLHLPHLSKKEIELANYEY